MRAPPFDERGPLPDSEAVLLVDDGHREVAEVDLLLDQRMSPDDELGIARRDELPGGGVLLRAEGAREQADPDSERRTELVDRQEVLLGQGLRRRHQRPLALELDRAQERVERDDGLPRADVPLQQPLHRDRALEIAVDLGDRALLVGREREGERCPIASHELPGRAEGHCGRPFALGGRPREREPKDEELVERESHPPDLGFGQRRAARALRRERPHEEAAPPPTSNAPGSGSPASRTSSSAWAWRSLSFFCASSSLAG